MAENDNSFGGRVTFEISPASLFTDMRQDALKRRFEEELPKMSPEEREQVDQLIFWMSVTDDIQFNFNGREKKGLKFFKDGWERHEAMTTRELLDFWLKLPYEIRTAWITEAGDGQNLIEVDPAQLPTNRLTDAQKDELLDKDSPLAADASPSS